MKIFKLPNKQKSLLIGLLTCIVILTLASQNCEGQIRKVSRGYVVREDSSVIMLPNIYREIRKKVMYADTAINRLENQIGLQQETITLQSKEINNLIAQNNLRREFISSVDIDLSDILAGIKRIEDTPAPKLPFYKTDVFLGGVIAVIVLSMFLS